MLCPAGNAALLLVLGAQHSFPGPGTLYLALILAVLTLELLCSMTWLLLYAGEEPWLSGAGPAVL